MTWKEEPMTMEWCLECHRHPERHLREQSATSSTWTWCSRQREQLEKGRELVKSNHISVDRLTNCSVCHR